MERTEPTPHHQVRHLQRLFVELRDAEASVHRRWCDFVESFGASESPVEVEPARLARPPRLGQARPSAPNTRRLGSLRRCPAKTGLSLRSPRGAHARPNGTEIPYRPGW
jgi:hypothetical protein